MTESTSPKSNLPKLSIMMFLQFWIWGAWLLTIPNYLGANGMGLGAYYAYEAGPLAAMIAPFFVGLVADRFFNTEKILGILFLLAGAIMLYMPVIGNMEGTVVSTFDNGVASSVEITWMGSQVLKHEVFSWLTLAHLICFMPTLALTTSLAFTHLSKGSAEFPKVRMWGTLGWIFAGIALPLFFNEVNDGKITVRAEETVNQFYLGGWAAIILGVFAFSLPRTPAPKKGTKMDFSDLLFLDVWKEFKNPSFAVFVICSFLLCIPLHAYYAFLQTQMGAMGLENISIWKNLGTWLEALMMLAMPFFFYKLGVKKMIAFGIFAWVLRYALFPLAAGHGVIPADAGFSIGAFNIPIAHMGFLLLIAGIALHGFCYDFFFVTGQIYVDQSTDKEIRGQAQSMLVFFTQGLGMYIGAKLNFSIFAKSFGNADPSSAEALNNWGGLWWPLCAIAAAILVIFLLAFKHQDKANNTFSHGPEPETSSEGA